MTVSEIKKDIPFQFVDVVIATPVRQLQVGDSFVIEDQTLKKTVLRARLQRIFSLPEFTGYKFATRSVDTHSIRIWRLL